jgi:hypothetical protein
LDGLKGYESNCLENLVFTLGKKNYQKKYYEKFFTNNKNDEKILLKNLNMQIKEYSFDSAAKVATLLYNKNKEVKYLFENVIY